MMKMTSNNDNDDDHVTVDRDFLAKVGTELTLAYLTPCLLPILTNLPKLSFLG